MSAEEISSCNATQPGPSPRAWLRLLGAWSLAVGLLIIVAWPVIATVDPGTFTTVINLSKRAKTAIKSAYPDIEASADGDYVAVVWSRGYNAESNTKDYGYIILKSAITGTGTADDGWENQVKVFTPTDEVWGMKPRAVFDPNDSSKLYVTWVECDVMSTDPTLILQCNAIKAATCRLTGADACSALPQVYYAASAELQTPDIAADQNGQLHVVWRNQTAGKIQYSRYNGSSWSTTPADVVVDSGGNVSANPALAWSSGNGGRLHLTWYQDNATTTARRIKYSADTTLNNDAWGNNYPAEWLAPAGYEFTSNLIGNRPLVKPSLAAAGTYVYAAWDAYKDGEYMLAYDWSANNGQNWQDNSGGSGSSNCGLSGEGCGIPNGVNWLEDPTYPSPFSIAERDALRPSIAISGTAPAIAWHSQGAPSGGENPVHFIVFREGITASGSITWPTAALTITEQIDYDNDTYANTSASPDLAMAPGSGVHIAHMGMWVADASLDNDWDIYYRGDIKTDNSTDDAGGIYLPLIKKNSQ